MSVAHAIAISVHPAAGSASKAMQQWAAITAVLNHLPKKPCIFQQLLIAHCFLPSLQQQRVDMPPPPALITSVAVVCTPAEVQQKQSSCARYVQAAAQDVALADVGPMPNKV